MTPLAQRTPYTALWPDWHPLSVLLLFVAATWLFWLPAAWLSRSQPGIATVLHYIGGAMPLVLTLVGLSQLPNAQQHDFWRRLVDLRRLGLDNWAIALLLPVGLTALAALGDRLLGGQGATPELAAMIQQPLRLLLSAVFLLAFGPIPEELAWRGYLLDPLQRRLGTLPANLTLGLIWFVWHLPLFFVQGSYQQGLGWGSSAFWLYALDKVPLTVILAWLYQRAGRSTLAAVLLHWSINLTGEMYALSPRAEALLILAYWLMAAWIARGWLRAGRRR